MPSVRNATTPAEGGMATATRVVAGEASARGTTGNPGPEQQESHVEQVCA